MDFVVNQNLELVTEPIGVSHFTTYGLLNSNYKSVVKQNFKNLQSTSVFAKRQYLKAFQFNVVNHAAVILKLSVFAAILVALF